MKIKRLRSLIVIVLICILVVTVLPYSGCRNIGTDKNALPVVIGAIFNLSGAQSGLGIPSSQGAKLAVLDANKNGGFNGREIDLIVADGKTDTAVVSGQTNQIIEHHPDVAALFGLSDTDMVLAAAPVAAASNRVFLTSGATSPKLPSEVSEYLFLACFGDNVQAAAGAEWAYYGLNARSVAIIYNEDHEYTRLLQGYFISRFTELGGKVNLIQSYKAKTLESTLHQLNIPDTTELIYLASWPDEVVEAVDFLKANGFMGPILGGDSFDAESIWQQNPGIESVYYTTHAYLGTDNPDTTITDFSNAYYQEWGTYPDSFAALAYDAVRLILTAIKDAGTTDPDHVRLALSGIENFKGITGTISYGTGNRIPLKSVSLIGVNGGKLSLVEQVMPEKVPAP